MGVDGDGQSAEGVGRPTHETDHDAAQGCAPAPSVSRFLARVVGALADFEDRLLFEDGFFAREEHFEAQIDALRREFDQNRRAQVLFSRPDAVGLLIAQLAASPAAATAGPDLHSRRQQQFVFAASVLLTSSTSVRTLHLQPALAERLWAFVARPAPLDPVQLQYWCRVAGVLLLREPGASPAASTLGPLVLRLLRHTYSDSVCALIKRLLGLPVASLVPSGAGGGGAQADAPSAPLAMGSALAGEHSLLRPCTDLLLGGGEAAANAADLLCTLCAALPERPDAIELCALFVRSFTPLLERILDAALATADASRADHAPRPPPAPRLSCAGRLGALRAAAAALSMEHRCSSLAEQMSWPSAEALQSDARSTMPFAQLLVPRLGALCSRLLTERSLTQVKTAELLATLLETAPPCTHQAIAQARLLEASVAVFLAPDVNGGGRQDAVRHLILRGLRSALGNNGSTCLHLSLVRSGDLPREMHTALTAHGPRAAPREFVRLLYLELANAVEREAALYATLPFSWVGGWALLEKAIAGECAEPPFSTPGSPVPSSPIIAPAPTPPELIYIEDLALVEPPADDDHEDEGDQRGEGPMPRLSDDAENIDPNSPEIPGWKRGRPRQLGACGTPRPATIPQLPSTSPPLEVSPLESPPPESSPPESPPLEAPPLEAPPLEAPPFSVLPESVATACNPGTPRPCSAVQQAPGTPRPDVGGAGDDTTVAERRQQLIFVDDATLRTATDFSRDTPQPKLVRRAYLHRKAKETSGSPTSGSALYSPCSLPTLQCHSTSVVGSGAPASGEEEDASLTQLRSSVRSLCF